MLVALAALSGADAAPAAPGIEPARAAPDRARR
jgi:hypothetical protein